MWWILYIANTCWKFYLSVSIVLLADFKTVVHAVVVDNIAFQL